MHQQYYIYNNCNITYSYQQMLILLYSDTNYVLDGFRAEFSVTPCPANCSSRGDCMTEEGVCRCLPGWAGEDCALPLCPGDCGIRQGRGQACTDQGCLCRDGFSGQACSLHRSDSQGNRRVQPSLTSIVSRTMYCYLPKDNNNNLTRLLLTLNLLRSKRE